ncbi:hypothetical protein [Paraliomyxa miuraensis]|uniref:hypothetical protein n=1 Tax=Paraliomyxa miuraensis TaxID=376150 RepID=UPI00224FA6B5|nr:hypothetical protein [Paraliomyxa miuraensis]MCX4246568.1 hypothetical protein [Paraliomyxa miuraensis]
MRASVPILSCFVSLAACTQTDTTPAGPLGQFDLRSKLPEGVTVPETLEEHEATLAVCDVKDDPFEPAGVHIVWHAFSLANGDAHVVDVSLSLVTPSERAQISTKGEPTVGSINLEPGAPWVAVALLTIACQRKAFSFPRKYSQSLLDSIQIVADGRVLDGVVID